jgi:H+/Cl- antiporter ClcA
MRKWVNTVRCLLIALVLALATPHALAQPTGRSPAESARQHAAGDADFGWLIILGLVGVLILIAWLISRMGDDGGRGPDHTML